MIEIGLVDEGFLALFKIIDPALRLADGNNDEYLIV